MFTAGASIFPVFVRSLKLDAFVLGLSIEGPISEQDFFTWEALISGPKDTPFVCFLSMLSQAFGISNSVAFQEGGVFAARLTFVSHDGTLSPNRELTSARLLGVCLPISRLTTHSRRSR